MKILLIDNTTKHLKELQKLLSAHEVTTKGYNHISQLDFVGYDAYILSGGSSFPAVSDFHDLDVEKELIDKTDKPVLGICFGFELIAHHLGSTLKRIETKRKGVITINKLVSDPIFTDLNELKVYEAHRYVVDQLGPELVALASSPDGIEVFRHRHKHIYGVQFHPEVFPKRTLGDEIFRNILSSFSSV